MAAIRPKLTILSPENIQTIHEGSLKVLAEAGLWVESARARDIYARAGLSISIKDEQVRFQRDVVEWAVQSAPSTYRIFNRRA